MRSARTRKRGARAVVSENARGDPERRNNILRRGKSPPQRFSRSRNSRVYESIAGRSIGHVQ
eukprot:5059869-Pyramimonas_sp.AAC.1